MSGQRPNDDDLIGQTIAGRYRIISHLGAGGMGVAYRAWDEEHEVPVVVKMPLSRALEDAGFAERFRREARFLEGLPHAHIVPIVGVGEHGNRPFVVMRFLPGGSLSNRRLRGDDGKPKPNPTGMLHLWLPAVADALDYVHSNGVVHRDVKPGNIFFDAFWGSFLGDFGIAKIVEESEAFDRESTLTATSMGVGTQEYMGPEQFMPRAVIDGRSDQYALAVTTYEMLAGVRPFTGSTAHLIVEVTTMPAPRLDRQRFGLPASLVEAVHRGLAKSPGDRFRTCREFAYHALRDVPILGDEPDIARLLCPSCSNLLKLPVTAAGQRGKCPRCLNRMEVADDLGALWLLDEVRRRRRAAASVEDVEHVEDVDSDAGSMLDETRLATEEELKAFEPVSTATPVGPQTLDREKTQASPRSLAAVIAAAGVSGLATIWLNPLALLHPTSGPIGSLLRAGNRSYAEPVGWTVAAVSLVVCCISTAWLIVQSRRPIEAQPEQPERSEGTAESAAPASRPVLARLIRSMPILGGVALAFSAILLVMSLVATDDCVCVERPYFITMAWADDDREEFSEFDEQQDTPEETTEQAQDPVADVMVTTEVAIELVEVIGVDPFDQHSSTVQKMDSSTDIFAGYLARGFNFASEGVSEQVPGGLGGRANASKIAAASGGGGDTEQAVDRALKWLVQHQMPDGGWSFDLAKCPNCMGKCSHSGESKGADRCGATAMALLPFLGHGYTHRDGPYKKPIEAGIGFLTQLAIAGKGKAYGTGGSLYSQGLAGIALSECYAMSQDNRLAAPTQAVLNFIMTAQDPVGGGWRYLPRERGDTSASGWQIMALKTGNMASLQVNPLAVRKAVEFLDSVKGDEYGSGYGYTGPGDQPGTSAVGLLCRMYLGWKKDHLGIQEGTKKLAKIGPTKDLYYNYYATQIMHHMEGEMWIWWNNKMKTLLLKSQSNKDHEAGSWYEGVDEGEGPRAAGRLYCTVLASLILEVYYRHLPLYREDDIRITSEFRE